MAQMECQPLGWNDYIARYPTLPALVQHYSASAGRRASATIHGQFSPAGHNDRGLLPENNLTGTSWRRKCELYVHAVFSVGDVTAIELCDVIISGPAGAVGIGGGQRLEATGHVYTVPLEYSGWFEILSQDGRSVREAFSTVRKLAQLFPERCLVRRSVVGYMRGINDGLNLTLRGARSGDVDVMTSTRVVEKGTILTLVEVKDMTVMTSTTNVAYRQLLVCVDQDHNEVCLDMELTGLFHPVAGVNDITGVHDMTSLLAKFRLPVIVRLVGGSDGRGRRGARYPSGSTGIYRIVRENRRPRWFALELDSPNARLMHLPAQADDNDNSVTERRFSPLPVQQWTNRRGGSTSAAMIIDEVDQCCERLIKDYMSSFHDVSSSSLSLMSSSSSSSFTQDGIRRRPLFTKNGATDNCGVTAVMTGARGDHYRRKTNNAGGSGGEPSCTIKRTPSVGTLIETQTARCHVGQESEEDRLFQEIEDIYVRIRGRSPFERQTRNNGGVSQQTGRRKVNTTATAVAVVGPIEYNNRSTTAELDNAASNAIAFKSTRGVMPRDVTQTSSGSGVVRMTPGTLDARRIPASRYDLENKNKHGTNQLERNGVISSRYDFNIAQNTLATQRHQPTNIAATFRRPLRERSFSVGHDLFSASLPNYDRPSLETAISSDNIQRFGLFDVSDDNVSRPTRDWIDHKSLFKDRLLKSSASYENGAATADPARQIPQTTPSRSSRFNTQRSMPDDYLLDDYRHLVKRMEFHIDGCIGGPHELIRATENYDSRNNPELQKPRSDEARETTLANGHRSAHIYEEINLPPPVVAMNESRDPNLTDDLKSFVREHNPSNPHSNARLAQEMLQPLQQQWQPGPVRKKLYKPINDISIHCSKTSLTTHIVNESQGNKRQAGGTITGRRERPRSFAGCESSDPSASAPWSWENRFVYGLTDIDRLGSVPPAVPPKRSYSLANMNTIDDAVDSNATATSNFLAATDDKINRKQSLRSSQKSHRRWFTKTPDSAGDKYKTNVAESAKSHNNKSLAAATIGNISRRILKTLRRIGDGRSSHTLVVSNNSNT